VITCWGDGKVNFRRAPTEVIRQVCEKSFGPDFVRWLLKERRRNPYRSLPKLLDSLDELDDRDRRRALGILTEQSVCYGLWITATWKQRTWYTFAVATGAGEAILEWREFEW
jgi:hypothetical protein